jgi:hypothetical protein
MRRNLKLKREVLVALDTDELARVAGGTIDLILKSGDICYENSRICLTDTCLTDIDCGQLTRYCLSRLGGGC